MSKNNNFKRLMDEEEVRAGSPPEYIGNRISHNTGLFSFTGSLIEVFLSGIIKVFVAMSGGEEAADNSKKYGSNRTPDRGFTGPKKTP